MNLFQLNPALRELLRNQSRAKLQRLWRGFRSPRRVLLSLIGLLLAALWIGQAVVGVLFRQSADPGRLVAWLSLGLTAFAIWNVLKIVFGKPVEPFEWTAAEKEWLHAAPLSRMQLICYRVAGIFRAAVFKAGVFSLVMIPDLEILAYGFIGMLLGLMAIELLRMSLEVIVAAVEPRTLIICRCTLGSMLAVVLGLIGFWLNSRWSMGAFEELISARCMGVLMGGLMDFYATSIGQFCTTPFRILADCMLASSFSFHVLATFAGSIGGLVLMILTLQQIDLRCDRHRSRKQRERWPLVLNKQSVVEEETSQMLTHFRRPPRWAGIGGLVWRQWQGVKRYYGPILVALSVPFVLACLPALGDAQGWKLIQMVIGLLVCYSLLLLPTTLKCDFRRDLDRIDVLKSLPIGPLAVTTAQLVVPVFLTSVFQLAVLSATMLLSPYHPAMLVLALLILFPFNVFVFALENLVFLLYPYRLSEEGIQIFIRSILMFTAKGLIAAAAFAVAVACLLLGKYLGPAWFAFNPQLGSMVIFTVLMTCLASLLAASILVLLSRTFARLDPSQDLAAAS